MQSRKRFPKEGKIIATSKGLEKVYSVDIFRDRVTVRGEDGTSRIVELAGLKAEMEAAAQGGVAVVAPPPPRPEGRARQRQVVNDSVVTPAPAAPVEASGAPEGEQKRKRRRRRRRRGPRGPGDAGPAAPESPPPA